jgi:nucleoside-diphosphate-sugar epimerase
MPVSYYAASKAVGFYRANEIVKNFGVGMFYGRISSAYGPGQYVGNLWPSLLQAVKTGSDFNMTTGRQVRDFIPVGAVAEVFLDAITKQDLDKPLLHVENVASGKSRTVEEWVASWWERLGAKGKINLGAIKESEFDVRCLNPSVSANISKIAVRHLKLNA